MAKINLNASLLISEYITNKEPFANKICELLQQLIHKANPTVIEDWKWNRPIFSTNKMICGFSAHKNHVSLTFFDGVKMVDKHQLFSDDCSARYTRTIKFSSISEINKNQLLDYFTEAFLLEEVFSKKKETKKEVLIPELLKKGLAKNKLAKSNFDNMAYTYRKEYALFISEAKREATKLKRLEKVLFNLEKNIKMHEQYKC